MFGGQVGVSGHLEIADGVQLAAQTGVQGSVKQEKAVMMGSPALDYRTYMKAYAIFKRQATGK